MSPGLAIPTSESGATGSVNLLLAALALFVTYWSYLFIEGGGWKSIESELRAHTMAAARAILLNGGQQPSSPAGDAAMAVPANAAETDNQGPETDNAVPANAAAEPDNQGPETDNDDSERLNSQATQTHDVRYMAAQTPAGEDSNADTPANVSIARMISTEVSARCLLFIYCCSPALLVTFLLQHLLLSP